MSIRDSINEIGKQTYEELYLTFLSEPMKGAVVNITDSQITLWFTNDTRVRINKSWRYSHRQLNLGDVEEFVVIYNLKKDRFILEVVGKDNSLVPIDKRKKEKQIEVNKITAVKDLPLGTFDAIVMVVREKYITLDFAGIIRSIKHPKNKTWIEVHENEKIKIQIISREINGKISGMMLRI